MQDTGARDADVISRQGINVLQQAFICEGKKRVFSGVQTGRGEFSFGTLKFLILSRSSVLM
jgi:hypothetical protein